MPAARWWALAGLGALLAMTPHALAAQAPDAGAPRGASSELGEAWPATDADCARRPDDSACAPDQRLERDRVSPLRRFATYSDLVAWARARVSLGLVLAPFPPGPLARLRFELEVVSRLRSPRGVGLHARVAVALHGQGLDGLFLGAVGSYVARAGQGERAIVGAELGYSRHFASLFLSASAGASAQVWAAEAGHRVRPLVRVLLGHAFY